MLYLQWSRNIFDQSFVTLGLHKRKLSCTVNSFCKFFLSAFVLSYASYGQKKSAPDYQVNCQFQSSRVSCEHMISQSMKVSLDILVLNLTSNSNFNYLWSVLSR